MKKLLIILTLVCTASNSYSVSINPAFVQSAMDENKYFIDYLNPHVSNFQNDTYFQLYKEAIRSDFEANIFFLSGEYSKAVEKILNCQKTLRTLYYNILSERYEEDTQQILKMSGPVILLAKDKKAEYYLRTGYSYLSEARAQKKLGFGTHKSMLSQKIKFYIRAIDLNIMAKRYAILALIESTIPLMDKTDYKQKPVDLSSDEQGTPEISQFEYLRNEIINNINKKSLPSDFPFLLHHNDNYYHIHDDKKSALNEISSELNSAVKTSTNEKGDSASENQEKNNEPDNRESKAPNQETSSPKENNPAK